MQHNNLPTPLLDFTTALDIGLYFAFLGMEHIPSNRIIENCVSLYIVSLTENQERLINISDFYREENKKAEIKSIFSRKKLVFFSPLNNTNQYNKEVKAKINIYSNFNIINQKGLFLYNYRKPIEVSADFGGHPFLKEVICIDIYKSLKHYILKKLKEKNKNLNTNYLFPSFNNFKQVTLTETLQDFTLL